jgi:hypothetical protein
MVTNMKKVFVTESKSKPGRREREDVEVVDFPNMTFRRGFRVRNKFDDVDSSHGARHRRRLCFSVLAPRICQKTDPRMYYARSGLSIEAQRKQSSPDDVNKPKLGNIVRPIS